MPASPYTTLAQLLVNNKLKITTALPRHLTVDRMIRVALTTYQQTPQLAECSAESILGCVIQAAQLGLELTGPLGQAYMVPRRNNRNGRTEATFQIGYRGVIDLAYRSGRVDTFSARVVYEHDHFRYHYGTAPRIDHVPTLAEPGAPVAVYAVLRMKGGASDFEVMSVAQVNAHRDRYSKRPKSGPWVWDTNWEEMAKKSVIIKLGKRAPVSVEIQQALGVSEPEVPQQNITTIDMGLGALAAPPPGRHSLKGNGAPALVPPGEEAPDDEGNARELADELASRLELCETRKALEAVGSDALRWRDQLGEAYYREFLNGYRARFAALAETIPAGREPGEEE